MDIKSFLKLLNRYKWILILVPLVSAVATYFLAKQLPKTYSSEAKIATGIVDPSKQVAGAATLDYFKMTQEFDNIIEQMKMRKIMSILSYNLIIHDLDNPKETFTPYSEKIDSLSAEDRKKVADLYRINLSKKIPVSPADNKGQFKLYDMVNSMGYGDVALNKGLEIAHKDNSDFISVKFISNNPLLSAYVVNTLSNEF
ncbi:MAG: lipopolysaccharide biosynthesis protein, partial [Pedobacter sp.]